MFDDISQNRFWMVSSYSLKYWQFNMPISQQASCNDLKIYGNPIWTLYLLCFFTQTTPLKKGMFPSNKKPTSTPWPQHHSLKALKKPLRWRSAMPRSDDISCSWTFVPPILMAPRFCLNRRSASFGKGKGSGILEGLKRTREIACMNK